MERNNKMKKQKLFVKKQKSTLKTKNKKKKSITKGELKYNEYTLCYVFQIYKLLIRCNFEPISFKSFRAYYLFIYVSTTLVI